MRPRFMAQSSIDSIQSNFAEAKRHYMTGDQEWFLRRLEGEAGLRPTRFDFPDFELTRGAGQGTDEEYSVTDTENVRILYSAMRTLPTTTASDERFWAGLAHTDMWDYVQYRRMEALRSGDDKKVKTSYFYIYDSRRSSRLHCLARLWWAGWLTYDEDNREDPFALTGVLTGHAFSSRLLLFSYTFESNRQCALGVLDAIKEQQDKGIKIRREHFVGANMYINRISGITLVDTLSRDDFHTLVSEHFDTDEFRNYDASGKKRQQENV